MRAHKFLSSEPKYAPLNSFHLLLQVCRDDGLVGTPQIKHPIPIIYPSLILCFVPPRMCLAQAYNYNSLSNRLGLEGYKCEENMTLDPYEFSHTPERETGNKNNEKQCT
jgi:hypothetical protein